MRLNGGEFLLNLLVLGALSISSESVTITDESVIKQLTGLKGYINNEKAIKPLFVKYDNGTEIVVTKGEIRKTKGALSFELACVTKSNSLTINVAFTQRVNANNDLIDDYYIADGDATLTFTNEMQIFENIIDEDGHKRFDNGNLTLYEVENVIFDYNKWALSGSHLLIVLCGTINENVIISAGYFADVVLPQWIKDKIFTINANLVDRKNVLFFDSSLNTQDSNFGLLKSNNTISIYKYGTNNITSSKTFRIVFDLLID